MRQLLTKKRDTIISYFSYNSGALAKGGMKEVTVNDIPAKAGYTRNYFSLINPLPDMTY